MAVFLFRAAPAVSVPVNSVAPAVTGTATEGQLLTCSTGSWSNSPTSYALKLYSSTSFGGTYTQVGSTQTADFVVLLGSGDVGKYAKLGVTATNAAGTSSEVFSSIVGPVASAPAQLLEDFATSRNNGEGNPLWAPYLGEDPNQSGSIVSGSYRDVATSTSEIYFNFLPRGASAYFFPGGYAQTYLKSGTWDTSNNRLVFLFRINKTVARNSGGQHNLEFGTYVRDHADVSDSNNQGRHFYHQMDIDTTSGVWIKFILNATPQHEVSEDPNTNTGNEPTLPTVGYFDGLTRFYFDTQNSGFQASTADFDDFYFAKVSGEPDAEISSITAQYNGTKYLVTWAGLKNVGKTYEIVYSTSSLKVNGWASGTSGGTATNPGSAYTGCVWTRTTSEQSDFYVGIRVQGGDGSFTEIHIPNSMAPGNIGL